MVNRRNWFPICLQRYAILKICFNDGELVARWRIMYFVAFFRPKKAIDYYNFFKAYNDTKGVVEMAQRALGKWLEIMDTITYTTLQYLYQHYFDKSGMLMDDFHIDTLQLNAERCFPDLRAMILGKMVNGVKFSFLKFYIPNFCKNTF